MKKIFFLLLFLMFLCVINTKTIQASDIFNKFEISNLKNGSVNLEWNTNITVKGTVYYGTDPENMDKSMGYGVYTMFHNSTLTGLSGDESYYYKIVAIDNADNEYESTIRTFSTDDMIDENPPRFIDYKIIQATNDAVLIKWTTDEETKANIYYDENQELMLNSVTYGSYDTEHVKFITKLKPSLKYYIKISAIDRDKNESSVVMNFRTTSQEGDLNVKNVKPGSFNSDEVSQTEANISWGSTLASKSLIYYGTDPKKVNKKVDVSTFYELEHYITLKELEPNTIYYYKIKLYNSFGNKSYTSGIMSFKTKALGNQLSSGDLAKGSNNKVYFIDGTKKSWIEDEEAFNKLGFKWEWIKVVDDSVLNNYREMKSLTKKSKHPTGTLIRYEGENAIYMLDNSKKRPFFTEEAFIRRGLDWNKVITVSSKDWKYTTGDDLY
ncbi:MAG: fibronectin type III domain-containing protein [Patescibacteria group bacterium]|nr:fibronectin type III domain-containing protein [Patescibacteria group bacterium]MDD4304263.1 fibronectin type III domain-containing protein [Patescibacteria group bacterium]MDD4695317.1 fibronectin type III domain-containing protein [Patescibacteria group bacterium]